ncbi:MAG: hypothetical protein ACR2NH_11430 [Solirubrobacteraceae bacterium]
MRSKITVAGVGGAAIAHRLSQRGYADLIVTESKPPDGWDAAAGSVLIVLAGKPGDRKAAGAAADEIRDRLPDTIVLITGEPSAALCDLVLDATAFPRQRVLGLGTVLESMRLRAAVARAAGVAPRDVTGLVLGTAERPVPVVSTITIAGLPADQVLYADDLDGLVAAAAAEERPSEHVVADAVAEIADAVVLDHKRVLPCAVSTQGEYDLEGDCVALPVRIGRDGVEAILEVALTDAERRALEQAAR